MIGKDLKTGEFCIIGDAIVGDNVKLGSHTVIEDDVVVGNNCKIGHHVVLKSGTRMGHNVDFADYCCTTGLSYIGNNVAVRTRSTVSKGVILEDRVFIGAGVMMSHTKNIYHFRPNMPRKQLITHVYPGAVIGSHSNLMAGVTIGWNVVIGYSSLVIKNHIKAGVYFGRPSEFAMDLPKVMEIEEPPNWIPYEFPLEMIRTYLSYASR